MGGHPELKDFQSVLNTFVPWDRTNQVYHLETIDVDGLHALYTRFYNGSFYVDYDPNDLGPWTDGFLSPARRPGRRIVRRLVEERAYSALGARPWTINQLVRHGKRKLDRPPPGVHFRIGISCSATDLTINLSTLRGRIDFTGLEHWGVNAAPGSIGSGTTWSDGDLRYGVIVRGNTFTQTGGDAGQVTGAFFGARHEGMGGVVERSDMSAGFGGTR